MSRCKVSFTFCFLSVLAVLLLFAVARSQAQSRGSAQITQSLDETKLAVLSGNTRPEATRKNDRGRVADTLPMGHMLLQLKRSPDQERELEKFIDSVQDSSSPSFHHWLGAREFGERFGLAKQDLDTITGWLESHGFTVNVVYQNGLLIDFSGTAGQVRDSFRTEIHNLNVAGVKHIANMSDPQIPAALVPAVAGVVSLHDFKPHTQYKPRADFTFGSGGGTYYAVVPSDLATIYNINPLFSAGISGQGQTIVLIEDTDLYSNSDWNTFRSVLGLSSYNGTLTTIHPTPPSGPNNCIDPHTNGDDGEAILDAEYASAAAPSAAIQIASCASTTTFGGLIAIQNLLNAKTAPPALISMSYGECEAWTGAATNAAFNLAYQQAVTEGVSVFVSSGDDGASMCQTYVHFANSGVGVNAFASTPYNVAVGGTDYSDTYFGTNTTYWSATNNQYYGSALSYVPEIPWNESCAGSLLGLYFGDPIPYGDTGFCNNGTGEAWLYPVAGSGGPSGCATGTPAQPGIVGGTCAGWPKPAWQSLVGVPNDGVRDLPDVSLFASNGVWGHYFPFCWSDPNYNGSAPCTGTPDTWAGAGGTSFASPIMAGIQALVNQKTGERQGNPNPVYYSLAANEYGASGNNSCNSTLGNAVSNSCVFYDITLGDNVVDCLGPVSSCVGYDPSAGNEIFGALSLSDITYEPAYVTTTGWDFPTGIGSINAANLVNNWPQPTPNFSLAANPASLTITQGTSGTSAIAIVPQGGFNGNVTLAASGLPGGVTAKFSPNPATSASTLTLTASGTATPGTVTVTITGTSGNLSSSATISLTVVPANQNFTLTAAPSAVSVTQGIGSAASTINITPVNGFSGLVTLTVSGLPKGVSVSLSANPANSSSVLTFTAASTAKTGTVAVTITGVSGSLSNSTTITLTVNPLGNFSLAATPKTLMIARGSSGTSTITVIPKDTFDQSVALIASGLPKGVTASFSPNPSSSASTLTLTVSGSATIKKSPITITGIYGTLSHQAFVTLTVTK